MGLDMLFCGAMAGRAGDADFRYFSLPNTLIGIIGPLPDAMAPDTITIPNLLGL